MPSKLVRFLDLSVGNSCEREELLDALNRHLYSGQFIIQDRAGEFEERFCDFLGRKLCVPVGSGTDALIIGLRLLDLKPGSIVITSPLSWIASTTAIFLAGLTPLFVDIKTDMQIDLDLVEAELDQKGSNITALLIPHLHGNCSDLDRLEKIRLRYGVRIVEDCAQAFGSRDINNRLAGSVGDVSAFSFNAMKVLGGLGDAGAIFFDDEQLYHRALALRHSGLIASTKYVTELSTNCRMDLLQASFLLIRLKYLGEKILKRKQICLIYNDSLSKHIRSVTRNVEQSNHYCYQTISEGRDRLKTVLSKRGVEARIRHDLLIPEHPALRGHFEPADLTVARDMNSKSLCLPMHENLSLEDVEYVINGVRSSGDLFDE
jgi:dTDP-4-amino-4,6-dideoxygalactose transaminase